MPAVGCPDDAIHGFRETEGAALRAGGAIPERQGSVRSNRPQRLAVARVGDPPDVAAALAADVLDAARLVLRDVPNAQSRLLRASDETLAVRRESQAQHGHFLIAVLPQLFAAVGVPQAY